MHFAVSGAQDLEDSGLFAPERVRWVRFCQLGESKISPTGKSQTRLVTCRARWFGVNWTPKAES